MKLYHGSPNKLKILKPQQAKGINKFENQKAVFLCKTFNHAALYAIGKSLKGKTDFGFGVFQNKLIILGNLKPKHSYVYEVDVMAKKGPKGQYSYDKIIKKFKIKKVYPKDFSKNIEYVDTKKDLMGMMK